MAKTLYGAEWTLLEEICASLARGEEDSHVVAETLADPSFSWGVLVQHAHVHKLQALLADHLLRGPVRPLVPSWVQRHLNEARAFNAHRIRVYGAQLSQIVQRSAEAEIPIAARKGIILDHVLFEGRALRVFCDLDLMVHLPDQARLVEVLTSLGCQLGSLDLFRGIVPLDRRELVRHRLNPDHFPRMVGPTGDVLVPYFEVDCATSLTWTNSEYQIPLNPAFTTLDWVQPEYCSVTIPIFPPQYQLLDGVLHLFREAFVESTVRNGLPVKLAAFLDISLLWRRYRDRVGGTNWGGELIRTGVALPVAWVLGHTDRLFGTRIVAEAGLETVFDDEWAAAWRHAGGAPGRWHGDMRHRLFHGGFVYAPATRPAI